MDYFDVGGGLFAVLLAVAYGLLLIPAIAGAANGSNDRNQLLTALACGLGGALLLARYQDILKGLVDRSYGLLSAEIVIGVLLVLISIFWLLIANGLVPWMGRALGYLMQVPFDSLRAPSAYRPPAIITAALATSRLVVLVIGIATLYIWFAIPSILVGLERALEHERYSVSINEEQQEQVGRETAGTLALAVYSDYVAVQNRLNERARAPECREPCQRRIKDYRTAAANTLAHYQIKSASPVTFKAALEDRATATTFQRDLRKIGYQAGMQWKKATSEDTSTRENQTLPVAVDPFELQERTDGLVVATLTKSIFSPGLSRLAPALRDPVLLLAFVVELCILITLLMSSSRERVRA